jgi:hypothetical protein
MSDVFVIHSAVIERDLFKSSLILSCNPFQSTDLLYEYEDLEDHYSSYAI